MGSRSGFSGRSRLGERCPRRRLVRSLARGLGIVTLVSVLLLGALELKLPGPFGMSAYVLYRTFRTFVRDLTVPTPPRIPGFANAGPNVVIIVLDCFRYDYVDNAPKLRAFGESGWWFDRYYSAAPWTKPSTASLFTGLSVRRHFVVKGGGAKLPPEALTLAELMQGQGLRTAGFVWNPHLTRRQSFDQGFDHYVDKNAPHGSKALLYEFFSWLDRERPDRFFAYIHFQGTHDPYYDDNDLSALISAPGYSGDLAFHTIDYKAEVQNGRQLSPEEAAHLKHIALGLARRVDRQAVGGFLERFEASGLPENTLVMITSDHGDAFFEHATVSHGDTVFNEEIHVPLMVHFPAEFANERSFPVDGRSSCPVSTVDLLPTALDFVGVPTPPGLDGVSLVPRSDEGRSCARPVISERTLRAGGTITGATIIRESSKLIVDYEEGEHALFDLAADSGETRDLSGALPEDTDALRALLARQLNDDGSSMADWEEAYGEIPEEQKEALRQLGYLE
jgi:arylsulfatase A-like enzyme